jgi:hypothetical protein
MQAAFKRTYCCFFAGLKSEYTHCQNLKNLEHILPCVLIPLTKIDNHACQVPKPYKLATM